jgi:hypothetical protein
MVRRRTGTRFFLFVSKARSGGEIGWHEASVGYGFCLKYLILFTNFIQIAFSLPFYKDT